MDKSVGRQPENENEILLRIYETAEKIRYSDERLRTMLMSGQVRFNYYSVRGQEIIPSATALWLSSEDYVITTYRGLHDQIAKGVPLDVLFAEYMGKATGACKGKGGPMHVTHAASGLLVTTGIVGGGLPIANGVALAAKLRNEDRVTVVNFGDGASNIGAFHEALNLAAVWELPVVFLCQNNLYGEHTAVELSMAIPSISERALAYGMPGVTVDGNDPLAMHTAAGTAISRARDGSGPTLLEARTFRFFGHSFGDDDAYMPGEQKARAMADDPVPKLRTRLVADGGIGHERVEQLEECIRAEVDDALAFALASDYPEPTELAADVYA
ncbi:MAG: pyruvate dehydrogenase [Acidimicrobiales bacterium]|jgi:TPP-dependent pyruvate/acetoin dehydrogenase alpha subunit|nr:pyruvate dehydrogenase [Acidimicrobiales bacterium]